MGSELSRRGLMTPHKTLIKILAFSSSVSGSYGVASTVSLWKGS